VASSRYRLDVCDAKPTWHAYIFSNGRSSSAKNGGPILWRSSTANLALKDLAATWAAAFGLNSGKRLRHHPLRIGDQISVAFKSEGCATAEERSG
jgi:hypothetical protein